jgi:hypothetical protein
MKVLKEFGFRIYSILVMDFLHEFELGVWKAILLHLIRILYAHGDSTVTEFNKRLVLNMKRNPSLILSNIRFRQIPTFSRSTIRKFRNDVAAMRKLTGRDLKDILVVRLDFS